MKLEKAWLPYYVFFNPKFVYVFVFNVWAIILQETKTISILLKVTHVEKLWHHDGFFNIEEDPSA